MAKKKQRANDLFSYEDLNKFFTVIKKNVNTLRKNLGRFEEPYSEISQNHKYIFIKVLLPDVLRRNLQVIASDTLLEIKAEQKNERGKTSIILYRAIDLPTAAAIKETHASYKRNKLTIVIPKHSASL